MATSQNGWTATKSSSDYTPFKWITGRVNKDANVIAIFSDFCEWYDKNIENIVAAHSWGWAYRDIRGSSTSLSNHASGTALDLNAPKHPLGKANTFSNSQEAKIRAKLKEYDGVLRWGGDYSARKDEMHYEINADKSAVAAVAAKLRAGDAKPTASKPSPSASDSTYTVKSGDTLSGIASANKTTVSVLVDLNDLHSANVIYVGQKLKLASTASPAKKPAPVKKPAPAKKPVSSGPTGKTVTLGDDWFYYSTAADAKSALARNRKGDFSKGERLKVVRVYSNGSVAFARSGNTVVGWVHPSVLSQGYKLS